MTNSWRNRIVRTGEINPEQLLAHPDNWRVHPQYQQEALAGSLDELGWIEGVIVQEGTDIVVDGHARVALALRRGEASIPVTWVDLSDHEVKLALALIDPISAMAVADAQKYDTLLRDIDTSNAALQQALAQIAAEHGLYPDDEGPAGDDLDDLAGGGDKERTAAAVMVVVGPYRFQVDRDDFDQWEEELRQEVGFEESIIIEAIRERLGLV